MRVLAFDIGIRNLAWCLVEGDVSGTSFTIHGWENYDLLSGMRTQDAKTAAKVTCSTCGKKGTHSTGTGAVATCARHCPADRPPLKDASGVILKRIPPLKECIAILGPSHRVPKRKADVLEAMAARWSFPIVPPKATRKAQEDLATIHDSIRTFVGAKRDLFKTATHILLENQPVFKNPTMKSVQILLFATLRDLLGVSPDQYVGFVHAGKKVKGAATGDAGYATRKKGGELRVKDLLTGGLISGGAAWQTALDSEQKKSDMCDALCMCMDRFGK